MSIKCEIRDGIVYTTVTGAFDYRSAVEHIDFLCANREDSINLYELHDYSKIEEHHLTQEQLINIASYAKKVAEVYPHSFVGVYAPDDVSFGIARQYEMFSEMRDNQTEAEIFRTTDEAIEYLKETKRKQG